MAIDNKNKVLNVPHLRFPEFSGKWEKHLLGEVGETIIGLTYKPSDVVNKDGIIVFRSSNTLIPQHFDLTLFIST